MDLERFLLHSYVTTVDLYLLKLKFNNYWSLTSRNNDSAKTAFTVWHSKVFDGYWRGHKGFLSRKKTVTQIKRKSFMGDFQGTLWQLLKSLNLLQCFQVSKFLYDHCSSTHRKTLLCHTVNSVSALPLCVEAYGQLMFKPSFNN